MRGVGSAKRVRTANGLVAERRPAAEEHARSSCFLLKPSVTATPGGSSTTKSRNSSVRWRVALGIYPLIAVKRAGWARPVVRVTCAVQDRVGRAPCCCHALLRGVQAGQRLQIPEGAPRVNLIRKDDQSVGIAAMVQHDLGQGGERASPAEPNLGSQPRRFSEEPSGRNECDAPRALRRPLPPFVLQTK